MNAQVYISDPKVAYSTDGQARLLAGGACMSGWAWLWPPHLYGYVCYLVSALGLVVTVLLLLCLSARTSWICWDRLPQSAWRGLSFALPFVEIGFNTHVYTEMHRCRTVLMLGSAL